MIAAETVAKPARRPRGDVYISHKGSLGVIYIRKDSTLLFEMYILKSYTKRKSVIPSPARKPLRTLSIFDELSVVYFYFLQHGC